MSGKLTSKKLVRVENYRSKDGVRAHVFHSTLGGDDIVVIEADTVGGDDAEVMLNVAEVASLRDWLAQALEAPAPTQPPCPSHSHPSCPLCNPDKTVPELNRATQPPPAALTEQQLVAVLEHIAPDDDPKFAARNVFEVAASLAVTNSEGRAWYCGHGSWHVAEIAVALCGCERP